MFAYLALGFIVIVLICLIYWFTRDTDESRRARADIKLAASAGVFDRASRVAFATINEITRPTARDYFTRARIRRYNIAENDTDILRDNVIAQQIAGDYLFALNLMNAETEGRDFILHDINDFQNQNRQMYRIFDHNNAFEVINLLFNAVNTTGENVRAATVQERVERAKETSATRAEAINTALDSATIYTDNRQNVHDSKINSDLRHVLAELKSTCSVKDPAVCIDSARKYITTKLANNDISEAEARDATTVLDKISRGEFISTYNDTESGIFVATWARCSHPDNTANKLLMRDAIIDALADSIEHGTMVCINGRCSRVLNALALLDFHPIVSNGARTFEAYRNQVFQETKEIINRVISDAKSDDALSEVATAYENGDDITDPVAEKALQERLKNAINNNIANYSAVFSPDELQKIEQECHIYAAIS